MHTSDLNMSHVAISFWAISNVARFALAEIYRIKILTNSNMTPSPRPSKKVHCRSCISESKQSLGKQVMKMKIAPPQK